MKEKIIYLLIGQKGSGKSFIGTLMEKNHDIRFVRVEDWAKKIKRERTVDDASYQRQAFESIEEGLREKLKTYDTIAFESTGLTPYFDMMLKRLRADFTVITIGINVEPQTCLERVRSRDQTIHVNIPDDQVAVINRKVIEKDMKTDFEIDNNAENITDLMTDIDQIIQNTISIR